MIAAPNIDYKRYSAHAKQIAFHHAVRKHDMVLFNGGRGSGKTTSGAIQAIMEATQYQPGERGIVLAPTYPMLEDATMAEFFKWLPRHWIKEFNKSRHVVTLVNSSEIAFRSADNPDSLRGPNRAWAWLDEPRNIRTREAFDVVYAQLRPTRKAWLTTTPKKNWLFDLFVLHPLPNSIVVDVRTAENPYLPEEYGDQLRTQYTGAFARQELDASWESIEGAIYDNWSALNINAEKAKYDPDLPIIWAVDDGYKNPRVILLCQERVNGEIIVFAEYYRREQLPEASINEVLAMGYPPPMMVIYDPSAVQFAALLWDRGWQTISANNDVAEGIKATRSYICDGNGVISLYLHPSCVNTIEELPAYAYSDSPTTQSGDPKPVKERDHGADALRYLIATNHAMRTPKGGW